MARHGIRIRPGGRRAGPRRRASETPVRARSGGPAGIGANRPRPTASVTLTTGTMMENCLFCRIIAGEISASLVHEGEHVVAFRDIKPEAPLHVLIVPRRHIRTLNDLQPEDDQLVGSMFRTAAMLAKKNGYADRGYRTVFNTNADAGQSVFHIHLHLLAGRGLHWPPG